MRILSALLAMAVVLSFVLAGDAAVISKLDDSFDDTDIGANPNGDGTGFQIVTNSAGGTGTATESGGQVLIQTVGSFDNTGIVSQDTLDVGALDTVTVTWDVAGATNPVANGLEFLVQGGTGFRATPFVELKLRPNGNGEGIVNNTALASDSYTVSEALDGFTAILEADADGWTFSNVGLPSLAPLSAGYGTSSFLGIFNGGRVTTTVQGTGGGATMTVNRVTASVVIPEPATLLVWSLLAAAGIGLGWRRKRD